MINIDKDYVIALRREIHQYPETDFDLPRTVALVERELAAMGIPFTEKYAKGSVVGYINPDCADFTIALRADMDALNMQEETDVPYRSKTDGKMHACGHDAHTAMLLGVAKYLKSIEKDLACRVKLIFQPSEEGVVSGALAMVENGVMDDVDIIAAQHIEMKFNAGKLGVCKGFSQASSRSFKIEIFGRAAHASSPHSGIDALATAVRIYTDLQLMVSRQINPLEPFVCNVGQLHSGKMQNNVPDYAYLIGTIRAFSTKNDTFAHEQLQRIVASACEATGATYKITAPLKSPSVYNNPYLSDLVLASIEKIVGKENVAEMPPKLGAEDFARYLEKKPGVLFRLGVKNESLGLTFGAHNSKFNLDENVLDLGCKTMVQFVLDNMHGIDKSML